MILVDANILMYASGADHPHKAPSMKFLERIARGELEACIDAEALQEVLHRYRAIGRWDEGRAIYDLSRQIFLVVLPVTVEALDRALTGREQFAERLASATARYGNAQLARRVGYLVNLLAGDDHARMFRALRGSSKALTPLALGTGGDGPTDPTWRLRLNIEPDRLLSHRHAA